MQKIWFSVALIFNIALAQAQPTLEQEASDTSAGVSSLELEVAPVAEQSAPRKEVGDATRALLALQAEGGQAPSRTYVVPGVVANKIYERYVNSFAHPIPERLASTIGEVSQ